jgi:hypothetical protein
MSAGVNRWVVMMKHLQKAMRQVSATRSQRLGCEGQSRPPRRLLCQAR